MNLIKQLFVCSLLFFCFNFQSLNAQGYATIPLPIEKDQEVLVNGLEIKPKGNGKYKYFRTYYANQLIIKEEGYLDKFYALSLKHGFGKDAKIDKIKKIAKKDKAEKYVYLNEIKFDFDKEKEQFYQYISTFNYRTNYDPKKSSLEDSKISEVEEQYLYKVLFNDLVEAEFIDTTQTILQNPYTTENNLNIIFKDVKLYQMIGSSSYSSNFSKIKAKVNFQLLDAYNIPVLEKEMVVESGEIVHASQKQNERDYIGALYIAFADAMQIGMANFLNMENVRNEVVNIPKVSIPEKVAVNNVNSVTKLSNVIEASLTIKDKDSHGSGFFISDDGYIVTNYHVVANMKDDITIIDSEGNEYQNPEIINISKSTDLALLKIEATNTKSISIIDDKKINVATEIYAIGTPKGQDLSQTISKGIISSIRKLDESNKLIQIDASVNSGNSGGPLVDENGELLGIVSSKLSGWGIEGVAFAIPYTAIKEFLNVSISK